MSLSLEDVIKIASLARLNLTDEELALYRDQLSAILDYAGRLNELDIAEVQPTTSAVTLQNVMREDELQSSLSIEEVLFNAPQQIDNQFLIQPVLEDVN
jgi:aspartyl-tRNA(Asn)/glutamyl-tRNA(Gln) amidotransferase subunit C